MKCCIIHEVFGSLYEQLNFDKLFTTRKSSASEYLKNIVMARIASVKTLKDGFGIRLNLDMVYGMILSCSKFMSNFDGWTF